MTALLLRLPVLSPLVLGPAFTLAVITVTMLLVRRVPQWRRLAAGAAAAGASVGAAALWVVEDRLGLIGSPLPWATRAWVIACFAALGLTVANWHRSRMLRKVGATLGAVVVLATTGLGINAGFALNPTLGSVLGISTDSAVALPPMPGGTSSPSTREPAAVGRPLWQTWTAPVGMPAIGTTGTAVIPGLVSGFAARPAGIYLPPAALTTSPPALPLVVLMMGQPGNPDPAFVADVLNRYAAQHHGLAPIVIVADQLGNPSTDTLCLDTKPYGNVETYINTDVVLWARKHLHVLPDRRHWTIAGYSHGGQCAISFAAKHPDLWGNVLDVSGEEYPGAEHPGRTLTEIFSGNQAAYDAQRPVNLLAARRFPDTTAIFTISTDDPTFMPGVKRVASAAGAAGMKVTSIELSGVGHLAAALGAGLDKGFRVLYPRLGLSQQ